MHEMSLAEGIIQLLEEQALRQSFTRVTTVCLELGQLASVEIAAIRFCFDAVCQGTLADGARLEIIEIPGRAYCLDCQQEGLVTARYDPCALCGGYNLQTTAGTEMRVKELEVV